ncbi:protein expanded isoform X2 [Daktulosphaira vitifoliae]|uniref:protein expanded isoform X2 n=1 Tax=Daktulosphaira vitifoliae TaxID=58002 RepID=UPI0021AAD008|nr:protein expanded isoform X2 [Daktulosphaira vitifoliae]
MRSASTVSGPLLSVSTPVSQQNRFAAVHLLTGQSLYFVVEGKSRVKEVYSQLTTYMVAQGMQDIELFALAFILDDEYFFADPDSKLSKYSPKSWKSSSTYGLDQNGQPLLQLHLRVKFYVDTTKSIRDEVTRQHYYLQLRKNIADRGGTTDDGDQNVLPLVALSLQADLGDHTADTDISSELLEQYLPSKVYKNSEQKVKQTLSALHKGHKGVSKSRAQTLFVQEAGLVHKSHLYRLRLNKTQPKQAAGTALSICNSVWLAICTNGIQLFHESLSQALSCLFLWNNIVKLCFDRKKFELRPSNADRLVYYTNSDEKSKRLLALCRDTHQFCMTVHPRLLDTLLINNTTDKNAFDGLKWMNEKKIKVSNAKTIDRKCENDSNLSILTTDQKTNDKLQNGSISSSVELGYSHTTQNSTVSELDYSVQSAQDSSDAYLMYIHPRARNAYVETSNQSAHTSSGVYTCPSYSSAKDTTSASYTTENSSISYQSENKSDALSPPPPPPPSIIPATDCTDSAYTSLPNGDYEATRNSARSPTVASTRTDDADDCNQSDEYTLSSRSHRRRSASESSSYRATTATTVSENGISSKCGDSGCGNRCTLDGYTDDAPRSRSGSMVSNSGSFRGDGSDPTDGSRGALLSAADLSDLIVGRKTLQTPRKGFYPSRPTTSYTLDSDSDYVTLPPPSMNFVTGAPSLSNLSLSNFDCSNGPSHCDVRRSFDFLSNVKFCNGHTHQCVINGNNYLDVHKSGTAFYHHIYPSCVPPPPPHLHSRQPPPPPPPPRPKRFDYQLEQYKQQLRSDVDFVVYPLQDPAVSRQEYADAKSARGQYHRYYGRDPPSYQVNAHLYRSTPNVAAVSHHHHLHHHHQQPYCHQQTISALPPPPLPPLPPHLKYASNQNLQLFPASATTNGHNEYVLPTRTFSHENLLSTAPVVPPKVVLRRRPPPPPPPVTGLQKPAAVVRPRRASAIVEPTPTSVADTTVLDIESLREKSRNLDLPLISALCNDQTLLKQTNTLATENKSTQTSSVPMSAIGPNTVLVALTSTPQSTTPVSGESTVSASRTPSNSCSKCTMTNGSFSPGFVSITAAVGSTTTKVKSNVNHIKTNTNIT